MINVERDPTLSGSASFSSFEIVSISRKPRKANLSKNLIALLTVRAGLNYGQMDDNTTFVAMIGSGISLDKPFLQH
nr:hypothetical protein [Tanacetum cinerariifolium]